MKSFRKHLQQGRTPGRTGLGQGQLISVIVISMILVVLIIGLSLKKRPKVVTVQAVAEKVDRFDSVFSQQAPADYRPEIEKVFHKEAGLVLSVRQVPDGLLRLYAMERDSAGWSEPMPLQLDFAGLKLNCIIFEESRIAIAGDRFILTDTNYIEVYSEHDFGSPVNVILRFGEGYLVGTNHGLYFATPGKEATIFKEDILVTALAEDVGGLWVGTFGDGLWRFDGQRWQRRYLLRDTSMFDFVNALTFNYPFLWVGTPSGIFRYNGGRWKQLFVSDSSEAYDVNCFLPLALRTNIGTEQGLFVFANDSLSALPGFENMQIVGLFRDCKKILVATQNRGIFELRRGAETNGKEEILRPEQLAASKPLSAVVE